MTFDEAVKLQKAAEFLIQNDALVHRVAFQMRKEPIWAIVMAAIHGEELRHRLQLHASRMTVSDEEREFGYPAPKTDEEKAAAKQRIAEIKLRL